MPILWLEPREINHFQKELLAEHGGLSGSPNVGALESTLARPQHLLAYHQDSTIFALAACYGHGIARNHCFPDGNKRVALASIDVFLMANGYELTADEADAVLTVRAIAEGSMSEKELSAWIETYSARLSDKE